MWPILRRVLVHLLIIALVTTIPVAVFSAFESDPGVPEIVRFGGGITYPLYIGYWISRIKFRRLRLILLNILTVLTLAFFASGLPFGLGFFLPAVAGFSPLLLAVGAHLRGSREMVASSLWSALLTIPLGAALSLALFVGGAMSGLGAAMHGLG